MLFYNLTSLHTGRAVIEYSWTAVKDDSYTQNFILYQRQLLYNLPGRVFFNMKNDHRWCTIKYSAFLPLMGNAFITSAIRVEYAFIAIICTMQIYTIQGASLLMTRFKRLIKDFGKSFIAWIICMRSLYWTYILKIKSRMWAPPLATQDLSHFSKCPRIQSSMVGILKDNRPLHRNGDCGHKLWMKYLPIQ